MSKRSAQGPQGSKESNLFEFNMNGTPDDKPQRATAAQMANRKIKEARRRPRATGSPSSSSASFGTPFSSLDPNTVSSPSAGQQPTTNGGFNFGQSQSFPPASPAPKPPTQNGGSQFAFGSGNSSSGFNFSASFGGAAATPPSNPFATINTAAPAQQPAASSFSGFKGNMFNIPSTQSPAQQPLPSGGMFGAGSQQSGSTSNLFGNTASSGPSQLGITAPTNGSMFGQSSTGAPTTNIFTQSGADKPMFAQSTAFGDDSMQTSPDAKSPAQKTFSAGSFGASTNFGGANTSTLFGGSTTAPAQNQSKPMFGAKPDGQAAPTTSSIFGNTTQPTTSSSASSSSAPLATSTSSPSFFGASTSTPAASNPFQFGTPASSTEKKPTEEQGKEETKPSQPSLSQPSFFPSNPSGTSLFPNTQPASPAQNSGPASTPSFFAPKPTPVADKETPKPAGGNPFANLFVPSTPAATEKPKTEQKPLPPTNMFSPKPPSTEGTKTNEPAKATTPASLFPAPAATAVPSPIKPQTPASQPPSSGFSFSNPAATTSAPAFTSSTTSQSLFKTNGAQPAAAASPAASTSSAPAVSFEKLQPSKMPSGLDKKTNEEVETAYRVRLLNECFQREVAKLNPNTEGFDTLLQFFIRIRETIGAPVEGAGTKRKASSDRDDDAETQPSKKVRPFDSIGSSSPSAPAPSATNTPSKPFSASQTTPSTNSKRKASEDADSEASPAPQSAKRANGDSTTASIFANSFSRSKTSESAEPPAAPSPKKLDAPSFKPSTPDSAKPALFSTTPTASPPKPVFTPSASTKGTSSSGATPAEPPSAFKPTFSAPSSNAPPANPFVLKPSADSNAGSSTAPAVAIPKFGSGNTNFFAQFKAQSDKNAEKEKEKRKAEDFDSDEDDEEEWERKDAEAQRKKREAYEAQKAKTARFIPGQGFSFEEENATTDEEKSATSPASSIFDSKPNSFEKSSNIFGHLSATPSESGDQEHDDDADDTEEASASGDDAAKDSEVSEVRSKSNGVVASATPESSDEGDFTKALQKSKQADSSNEEGPGGRSLFDRVQYDDEGKPKRDESDKGISSILGSSKYSSSFNSSSSTPNPFATLSQREAEKSDAASKPASTNIFGSSTSSTNIFGGSTPAASGTSTPSIFATGSSATKPSTDKTWTLNSPIKFAPSASTAKSDSEPAPSASETKASDTKPFSLFGDSSAGSKSGSALGTSGFSFGGPSQPGSSSLLTPPVLASATPSRASTPGGASDTGAESTDGDGAESLPQADLRSGAGEENEDVLFDAKTKPMKIIAGTWKPVGEGFVRILKDRTTSRARILVRADPTGKILLNASLLKALKYTANKNSVQFMVPQVEGPPEQWAIRVRAGTADNLASIMEENKA